MPPSDKTNEKNKEGVSFLDLFTVDDIQRLQDEFALATGVASIITKPDGTPITKPSNFCRFCSEVIRNTEKGRLNCYKSDAIIGQPNPDGPTIQTCMSGGLWDAGAGITVGGKHIANWLIGQVRDKTKNEDEVAKYADEIGANKSDFLSAYREVPAMSPGRFKNIASMLFTLANQISSIAYQNVTQTQLISKLRKTESELRKNQQNLIASERRLSIVVDNLPSAMIYEVEVTPKGERDFTYVSENVYELNKVTPDSVLANADILYSQVHPDDLPDLIKAEETAIQTMNTFRHEARFILPSGELKWFQLSSRPSKRADGVIALDGIEIDITDQKNAEEEKEKLELLLRQSQKLEAIGQLAGGVAHDLNNLLTPILGYSELLFFDKSIDDNAKKKLTIMSKAATGAKDLVNQLLAFSRKQILEYRPLDINLILDNFESLIRRTVREDIEIRITKSAQKLKILADQSQIEQVLLNLVVNASDAMPNGGTISIITDLKEIDQIYTQSHLDVAPGSYVTLCISDTGKGMNEETLSKIFEPFFSTKGNLGTGLGLATVYGIIKQHDGSIRVDSKLGKGTTFKIYLPAAEKLICMEETSRLKTQSNIFGTETILLVEDNEAARITVSDVLQDKGYQVITAENGEEALEMVSSGIKPDILLTDVVMPRMNGKELFIQISKHYTSLKVLYMSGYPDDIIAHHGVLDEQAHFIQKPFTSLTILEKVRNVLDS